MRGVMKRRFVSHFSAVIGRYAGLNQVRERDPDVEQAWLRVILTGAMLIYAAYVVATDEISDGLRLAIGAAATSMTAGIWMLWRFRQSSARTPGMRFFGICADLIPLTIGLWGAGEPGVPLVGLYIWVTVGNGFRFGPRYLMAAYWLSLFCFTLLLTFEPFWMQHRSIGIGFGLVLATIPLYVLVLLSRITAQKDAAVQLSNAKSRFVANVSHELRTPLTGVFAVYDLLTRRRLAPDEKELVGSLGSAITTLKASVDAILQMSKLEAGAERAESRLFNLRFFLWQLDALVRPQAEAKRLAWSLALDPDLPAAVVGDPSHLQHVLGNLVNNALKFTPKGGVTLRVEPCAAGVRFEVIDTGIGIPLEKQETLFERFVRVDESATRRYGGTGLGTSIAHDLVLLMGGAIGVHSAPGQGSTFWVELPLAPPAPGIARPDWDTSCRAVLVVGRSEPGRDELMRKLVALGLTPVAAETVAQQPPPFDPERYLAALLVLPVAEAALYTDELLRDRAGLICPWLVVTSVTTPTQAGALLRSGAAALLAPDVTREALHTQLAALVHRRAVVPDDVSAPVAKVGRALNILLADDNHSNQLLLARILTDAGHAVQLAERGDEAYDMMAQGGFDLAILDLNMPEMSGPDVIKLYRAGEVGTGHRMPVIVLSADATPVAQQESLDAGANDYLTKPVTSAHLIAAIERLMAGAQLRQAPSGAARSSLPADRIEPTVAAPLSPVVATASTASSARNAREPAALVLVDSERIEALRRIANRDQNFLQQYTAATFDDLDAAVAELGKAVAEGNMRGARDALHKIDGTSASIGAIALAANAKSMRNYLSSAPDSDAAAALAELATTTALTKSAVSALLQEGRISNRNPR